MTAAELHLASNHVPVIGIFGATLLLLYAGARRSAEVWRAGLIVLVILGALAFVTYFSGEPAEKVIKHLPGVTENQIAPHEKSALFAIVMLEIMAVLGLIGLGASRARPAPRWHGALTLLLALMTSAVLARTAYLGGRIRHTELRPDFVAPPATAGEKD